MGKQNIIELQSEKTADRLKEITDRLEQPGATQLAGFQTLKKFGQHVKKGEKGIKVIAPAPYKKTVGKPLPSIATPLMGSMETFSDIYAALEQVSPVPIGFEDIPGNAYGYYSPMEKRIAVRDGLSEQQTLKTLSHEISHAKLHDVDLSKPKDAGKELKELRSSLEMIRNTAAEIIDGVEDHLHELRQQHEADEEISSPALSM